MIEFALGIVVGMMVAYVIVKVVVWSTLRQLERDNIEIDELMTKITKKIENNIIAARMEEYQGQFYIYRTDNNEFIAQGATAAEIDAHTDQRFGKKSVIVTDADPAVLSRYLATKNTATS